MSGAIATAKEAEDAGMTIEEAREHNKKYLAACGRCGGWTYYGGMSQYNKSEMGCHSTHCN